MMDIRDSVADYVSVKFKSAVDKAGNPYIIHCRTVAENASRLALDYFGSEDLALQCFLIGYCHDVLEDTDTPREELVSLIGEENTKAVELLSHPHGDYDKDAYFAGIKSDLCATIVKCADATHNSDISRFSAKDQTPARVKICAKYAAKANDLRAHLSSFKVA